MSSSFTRPRSLTDEIARNLVEAITRGDYELESFLPSEHELAEKFGASRNAIREAIKILSARSLIEVLHGRGSRVRPVEEWQVLDRLIYMMRRDPRLSVDLLEVRRIFEVSTAALAAERATDDDLEAMRATIEEMRRPDMSVELAVEHDIEFHRALAKAARNTVLPLVLSPVDELLKASRLAMIRADPRVIERSADAHERVLERVREGDVDGAKSAMSKHLEEVESDIETLTDEAARLATGPPAQSGEGPG